MSPRANRQTPASALIFDACQVGVKDGNYVVRMELPLTEVLYLKSKRR
jgi:hypothetical protein